MYECTIYPTYRKYAGKMVAQWFAQQKTPEVKHWPRPFQCEVYMLSLCLHRFPWGFVISPNIKKNMPYKGVLERRGGIGLWVLHANSEEVLNTESEFPCGH